MNKLSNIIRTARWDISLNCNLNCIHCCAEGFYNITDKNNINSSYGDAEFAYDLLYKLRQNGITQLNILGKEPFLHPNINAILQYACKLGFQVDITTNGTSIRDRDIEFLVSLGLRCIYFSIDGSSPAVNDLIRGRGVFNKVISTLQKFQAEKKRQKSSLSINVNTTLTKINSVDILNMVELCSSNEVNFFKLSRLEPLGNASRHLKYLFLKPAEEFEVAERLIKIIPDYTELKFDILSSKPKILEYFYRRYKTVFPVRISGCKACIKEIYIDPFGNISPCPSTSLGFSTSDGNYKRYKINIFEFQDNICKHPFYEEFKATYPLVKETYKKYIPCNSCDYLATICYPCPLGSSSIDKYNLEDLCSIADKKLSELNNRVGA
ncbi:MAG: radical SAM protein [Candidatus Methanoperedens sp.]|nr:radical SAM protein [Candidatus Methanoperedens sp.]